MIAASATSLFWLQISPLDRLVNLDRGRGVEREAVLCIRSRTLSGGSEAPSRNAIVVAFLSPDPSSPSLSVQSSSCLTTVDGRPHGFDRFHTSDRRRRIRSDFPLVIYLHLLSPSFSSFSCRYRRKLFHIVVSFSSKPSPCLLVMLSIYMKCRDVLRLTTLGE